MPRRRARHRPSGFRDRRDAGRRLAAALTRQEFDRPVILALPRGGVPVAAEVAAALDAPLDVLVVRKLGCPGRPEFGIGAIAEGGIQILNDQAISHLGITAEQLDAVVAAESAEVTRRVRRYRGARQPAPVRGRTVIVVDDGLATGFTARAAVHVLRALDAERIVVAVPVAPAETVAELSALADDVVCLHSSPHFLALGQWYADFSQVADAEVTDHLSRVVDGRSSGWPDADPATGGRTRDMRLPVGSVVLTGTLTTPPAAIGAVIFVHGSGSSRLSPRNRTVARVLEAGGLATLLFDLLDEAEAQDRANVFDVDLLAGRLTRATQWLRAQPEARDLPIGYFGASTGAAAALRAAAQPGATIAAIVSRGGRPDLAGDRLGAVTAPVLLIVGGRDAAVIELNVRARQQLRGVTRLEIVPGATHLFSEPGALELVSVLAQDWFTANLRAAGQRRAAAGSGPNGAPRLDAQHR